MSRSSLKSSQEDVVRAVIPRLFVLELNAGRIHSMNTDGSGRKTIVSDCHLPDGIVVDVEAGHIYWTNMGIPSLNDGSVERADIDGKNRKTIVGQGDTHSPKQIASEYPVQAIYMTKAVLGGRATQLIGPCAGKSPPLTTRKSGVQDMMGGELLLFDSAWLCRKAFQLIAEDRNCSLKARDVRAW